MTRVKELKEIESTLNKLYEENCDLNKKGSSGHSCRASLFNLVIWAPSEARGKFLSVLIDKIAERFPCRILFITQSDDLNQGLEIDVSLNLKGQTACDLIEIKCGIKDTPHVSYFILPHLLPDLPMYLLWGQDPTARGSLFDTLYPYAKRVIFDSICVKDLPEFAKRFSAPEEIEWRIKLRDINWSLISGWKSLFVRLFETKEQIEAVRTSQKITLTYKGHSSLQAMFFKEWLISKLTFKDTQFELIEGTGDGIEGDLLSIEITFNEGIQSGIYRKGTKAVIHQNTADTCALPTLLPITNIQRGFHFWRELLFEDKTQEYLAMIKVLQNDR